MAGRRRKAFLVGSISAEILEDNTTIWGRGTLQGSKKKPTPREPRFLGTVALTER